MKIGYSVKLDSATGPILGTITKVNFSGGNDDSAILTLDAGNSYYSPYTEGMALGTPLETDVLYIDGAVSGKTQGMLLDSSYSYQASDGLVWSDMLRTSNYAQGGDSGEPLFTEHFDGNTRTIYGIQSAAATDGSYSIFTKYSNIKH